MYIYIKGALKVREPGRVIIENNGIGYELSIGLSAYESLPEPPAEVMLHTYHYIREDREELYGFSTKTEKKIFELLIGVSGVGPGKAIGILAQVPARDLASAVIRNDAAWISSVKGIGRKTAERLLLDLQDKMGELDIAPDAAGADSSGIPEAVSALMSLGFREGDARSMVDAVRKDLPEGARAEDIVRRALKYNE